MYCLYTNALSIILLIVNVQYCTATNGHPRTIVQSVANGQEEYANSTYQFESESGHVTRYEDNGVPTRKSKRGMQHEFISCCSKVQPKLLDGYYYKFNLPSSRQFLNHIDIISVGYAYLLAFESNVLKKPDRYFDISVFLNTSGLVFPPTLLLVCYDTGISLQESPLFNYGIADILRDLNAAEGVSSSHPPRGSNHTRLSATRHLDPNSGYMIQRRKMYGEVGALVQNMRQGQLRALKSKCSETAFRKVTYLITTSPHTSLGTDIIQAVSPKNSLEQFNEVVKLFIGDIVAYEIIRQACAATCIPNLSERIPEITAADWTPVAKQLSIASNALRNNWPETQLHRDILESALDLTGSNFRSAEIFVVQSSRESLCEGRHADALMEKYYQYGFRVSSHAGWATDNPIVQEMCKARQNQKCIDKNGKLFIVKWKSLKPSELSASHEAQQQDNVIKFPIVAPPSSSHRFSALYTKVQEAFKKIQNVINYFRVNELQQSYYKNVDNLINVFDNSAGYDFYSKTAGHFAKILDVLNVFRNEFQPLISTLSEVAMHVGTPGIDKVWRLIDRSFNEMDFYMSDIEEHVRQMREKFMEKYGRLLPHTHEDSFAYKFVFGGSLFEEVKKIRRAFKKYQHWVRFYTTDDDTSQTPMILKDFIDKCTAIKSSIETLPTGVKAGLLGPGLWKLGMRGPFYIQTFLLVPLYDTTYMTLYGMFCAVQRYRWLAERDQVSSERTMSTADIQQFIHDTQQDVWDVSKNLDELLDVVSTYSFRGEFYWIKSLWNEITPRFQVDMSAANAERVAHKLKDLFPWNNFTVDLIKPYTPNNVILVRNEKIYYYKFLANPDYSMVRFGPTSEWTMIVNWVPDKSGERSGDDFGSYFEPGYLCRVVPHQLMYTVNNYQNIKSFFIWRTKVASTWITKNDRTKTHDPRPEDMEDFKNLADVPSAGVALGVKRSVRSCWYQNGPRETLCHRLTTICAEYDKLDIYSLGNFGEDY